jgi:aryl-alcohol dehydrogenase-like predicted oxidoreductase
MLYRKFGRVPWNISEVGYGMWGLASWTGSNDAEVIRALDRSVELGCNFYDTAWIYGNGKSETILGQLTKRHPQNKLHLATKIPPKNMKWPSKREFRLEECFPVSHVIDYTERSLKNLCIDCIDLQQFHVWEDEWADQDEWKEAIVKLKKEGKVKHFGISVNRWEPENVLSTLETGFIDSVQVIYNVFDQAPEDQLFPLCRKLGVGVIARVPFDEGSLTGTFTKETTFPKDDWRATYFTPENLTSTLARVQELKSRVPSEQSMAEMALRFILTNDDVHTIIPGMRRIQNVERNILVSDGKKLDKSLYTSLKNHRWDRVPKK